MLVLPLAIAVAAVCLVPIGYVVLGGFRSTAQLNADAVTLPHPWVFENYRDILVS